MAELHKVAVRKKVDQLDRLIQDTYLERLEDEIPNIINIILNTYDAELTGRVTDRRSRTNPIYYRDEFESALDEFEWFDIKKGKTVFFTPETNTFNWNQGRLRIIENILEGTIGTFIEVDEEQYIGIYEKRPAIQPFDRAVPLKERIYLLRLTGDLRRRWRETFPRSEMVRYPFSNAAPIDIFSEANRYVEENLQGWIDDSVKMAQKEIAR
jgi:hypothetical protein